MAVYLSPGVFPVEIDLSALPTATGPLLPVFIGTAQKGPINTPTFVSSSQEFIDTFGNPIDDSPLGFAVLNYMEEGNEAWILRVGVEAQPGQDPALAAVAIDTSGAKVQGWGRIPLFTGIDSGRLTFRTPTSTSPFDFHVASVSNILFTNVTQQQGNAPAGLGPVPVNLNTAANYSVFGETGITASTPGTLINGDIAVSPISHTALVGFNLVLDGSGKFATSGLGANGQVVGKIFASDYAAPTPATLTTATTDILNAYNDAASRTGATALSGSLDGMTLAPGLYKQTGALTLGAAATVTLHGGPNDVWIIQVTGALTTGAASNVVLTGGAQAGNVFWQVAGGVTLGAASNFEGVILSATTISMGAGASATSRLLAQTAVTLDDDTISPPAPVVFSPASVTLIFTGSYTGPIEDSYNLVITGAPDTGGSSSTIQDATFQIVRNSDGAITNTGTLHEGSVAGLSQPFLIGVGADNVGLTAQLQVLNDVLLQVGDVVSFQTHPDNRTLEIQVQGLPSSPVTFTMPSASYTTTDAFVTAFNTLVGVQSFIAENTGGAPQIVTVIEGNRIQLMGTEAFALHVGVQQYAFDIPRSFLLSGFSGPFNISSINDRVKILSIGPTQTVTLNSSIPDVLGQSAFSVASALNLGGTLNGHTYYVAFLLTVATGDQRVCIVSSDTDEMSILQMQANFSNVQTLKFAEELDIPFPYTRNYRGFSDPRVALPQPGLVTPAVPHSCELSPSSAQCAADTAYFKNIVGYLVATSPGTWVNGLKVNISPFNNLGNKFTIQVFQGSLQLDRVDNVSFDQTDSRYIANVVNPGTSIGGANGNKYYNFEARPSFLDNDPSLVNYEVRNPVPLDPFFVGGANGIPPSAIFSSVLDAEIIGNPATSTGMFAFQNPEKFDVSLLLIPGNSSGAVIGQALQLCESRGDMLYIVDPPFGLRPQQVVDWHNGMLFSDLTAAIDSSYGALYWPWIKIFNQFDATELFVPPSGFVASVFSRTARVREQWFAPAGLQRGHLLTALDVEFNATQGERDLLYGLGNAVNPIVNFPQDGITVFGQRTLQRRQTALDRVNVRMLLIFLKKNLVRLLRFFLFEPIDRLLFAEVRASITPFLQDVMARRGVTAFKVICDDTNNTPETIDRNELHVSVLLKPTKAAEFIVLNLVILRSDASFSAEEVLAAAGVVGATTQVI
jgi:hypothetical protein